MVKAAVVLSGCGFMDGAEIRESVLALLYLDEQGAEAACFAPDMNQTQVVNHLTGKPVNETRNALAEAARIARGDISDLKKLRARDFDALMLPGGYGAATTLSDFAQRGKDADVLPELERVIKEFLGARKPIGAICIAPAVLALAARGENLALTIGKDAATASAIEALGHRHVPCEADRAAVDQAHGIATCPAYMADAPLAQIAAGIRQVVELVVSMAKARKQAA